MCQLHISFYLVSYHIVSIKLTKYFTQFDPIFLNKKFLNYLVYLTLYDHQDKYYNLFRRFDSLNSYFNKFANISYPISYALSYYETYNDLPTIYAITPTYSRETQLAELTRIKHTLWIVPKIVWIIVEDAPRKTYKVEKFLQYSKLNYIHLQAETPDEFKVKSGEPSWSKPRGVIQRNHAITWLRDHSNVLDRGVVFFMDDDNTYDIRVFEEVSINNINWLIVRLLTLFMSFRCV